MVAAIRVLHQGWCVTCVPAFGTLWAIPLSNKHHGVHSRPTQQATEAPRFVCINLTHEPAMGGHLGHATSSVHSGPSWLCYHNLAVRHETL